MAKNRDYWKKRFEVLEERLLNKGESYLIDLDREYKKATASIQKDITMWYKRFADNNEVSFSQGKKLLNKGALEEFRWTVEEYIKYGKENAIDQRWMKELENASARAHISRLEALKIQLQQQAEVLYGNQLDNMDSLARDVYAEGYYNTAFEIQKGFNVGWSIPALDTKRIDSVLSKPWASDGIDFSSRIWKNRTKLISELNTQLIQSMIRGDGPDKMISSIAKKFDVSKGNAGRLVMTESAFFASASQKDCFNELGVGQYEIVSTLDSRTSEICQALDGKVFSMSDYKTGDTAPPFHVRCRTCTAPYFDDEEGFRVARGVKDEVYYISSSMKYPEWHDKYVKGNPKAELAEKKIKNSGADKGQHKRYKELLGRVAPKSLDEFQNIKYTNELEYGILKAQAKGMGYYNQALSKEAEITQFVTQTAQKIGMKPVGLKYRVKGIDSFLRKIKSNYDLDGNEYEIKDILRYTYTAPTKDLAEKTMKSIEALKNKGYNTIEMKNTWTNKNNPYKGINTIVISPNGQKFELQYHTPESFKLKDCELHELYEEQRLIADDESDEFIKLQKEMQALCKTLMVPEGIDKVRLK